MKNYKGINLKTKSDRGITLIILVITIVVMLILAASTITILNGGLFEQTGQILKDRKNAINWEEQKINEMVSDYLGE